MKLNSKKSEREKYAPRIFIEELGPISDNGLLGKHSKERYAAELEQEKERPSKTNASFAKPNIQNIQKMKIGESYKTN